MIFFFLQSYFFFYFNLNQKKKKIFERKLELKILENFNLVSKTTVIIYRTPILFLISTQIIKERIMILLEPFKQNRKEDSFLN